MRHAMLVLISVATTGCTAQMVNPAGATGSRYAPTNDSQRPGLIKYLVDGASFVVKKRRENAYKQMFQSCRGPYRIVAEGQRVEGGVVLSNTVASGSATARTSGQKTEVTAEGKSSTITSASEAHYWYIQYECAAKTGEGIGGTREAEGLALTSGKHWQDGEWSSARRDSGSRRRDTPPGRSWTS